MRILLSLFLALASITLFAQTSDFNDGTTQGWDNGNAAPDPTVQTGGPDGSSDQYLRIVGDGNGAGGRVAVFNTTSDWTGNYIDNEIGAIELNAANFSNQNLTIRIAFEGNNQELVTAVGLELSANDDSWQSLLIPIGPEDLVGSADYNAVMSNVTKVWIFHGGTSFPGPFIAAEVGVDNVAQQTDVSSVNTLGPDVFQVSPIAQPAVSGQAALAVQADESGNWQADIFDLSGRRVLTKSGTAQAGTNQRIDLAELQSGQYVVRFALTGEFGNSIRSLRLLVQ